MFKYDSLKNNVYIMIYIVFSNETNWIELNWKRKQMKKLKQQNLWEC